VIEKLLQRIAGRGRTGDTLSPESMLSDAWRSSSEVLGASAASLLGERPRTRFPLKHLQKMPIPGTTIARNSAWHSAIQSHLHQAPRLAQLPAYFAGWGVAHMAVALQLWQERERLHMGYIELIADSGECVASLYPHTRRVMIKPSAYKSQVPQADLLLRQQEEHRPTPQPAQLKDFETTHLHALLWFLGQAYGPAVSLLPAAMATHRIELRRFPMIEPAALDVRHIALLNFFSAGAQSFEQLSQLVTAEQLDHLCADLCSLHLTGTLKLLPPLNASRTQKSVA
jgi:hypothetical protein